MNVKLIFGESEKLVTSKPASMKLSDDFDNEDSEFQSQLDKYNAEFSDVIGVPKDKFVAKNESDTHDARLIKAKKALRQIKASHVFIVGKFGLRLTDLTAEQRDQFSSDLDSEFWQNQDVNEFGKLDKFFRKSYQNPGSVDSGANNILEHLANQAK
jgi:hypothetical protein